MCARRGRADLDLLVVSIPDAAGAVLVLLAAPPRHCACAPESRRPASAPVDTMRLRTRAAAHAWTLDVPLAVNGRGLGVAMTPTPGGRDESSGAEPSRHSELIDSSTTHRSTDSRAISGKDAVSRVPAAHGGTQRNTHSRTHRARSRPCECRQFPCPPRATEPRELPQLEPSPLMVERA